MSVAKRWALLVAVLITGGLLVEAEAWANQPNALLETTRAECLSAQSNIQARLDRAQMYSGLLAILGAGIAAAASVFAGFSKRDNRWRRASAVVGVVGAMVPLVPQVLPNTEALRKQLQAADRHLLAGEKVFTQLEDTEYEIARVEFRKYAKARFVECRSQNPSDQVPDFPRVVIDDPSEQVAPLPVQQPAQATSAPPPNTRLIVGAAKAAPPTAPSTGNTHAPVPRRPIEVSATPSAL